MESVFKKPADIGRGQFVLWVWTFYATVVMGYFDLKDLPDTVQSLNDQAQGLFTVTDSMAFNGIIAEKILIFAVSAWVIASISLRRIGGRSTVMWAVLLQAACYPFMGTFSSGKEIAKAIPDIGLQILALALLYSRAGTAWFKAKKEKAKTEKD